MSKKVRVCIAGATGWTGSLVAKEMLKSSDFELVAAIARQSAGIDLGEALGLPSHEKTGVIIAGSLPEALQREFDVLIDYTKPDSVKARTLDAIKHGVRVVVGTSGMSAADYEEIEAAATRSGLGVIAAGNFSITAALAKHMSLLAAEYLPSREIIDYAGAGKVDAPSGTVRELAEALADVRANELALPIEKTMGSVTARGATIGGTQVHSVRMPSYVLAFETIFGLPDERLVIRHDAGTSAAPYVAGTLLAARQVISVTGLVRGLDQLLFSNR